MGCEKARRLVVLFVHLFAALSVCAAGEAPAAVVPGAGLFSTLEWIDATEDAMDRARTFYRALEAIPGTVAEDISKKGKPAPVVEWYSKNMEIGAIKEKIPASVDNELFELLMPEWPLGSPVSWRWVEASPAGIVFRKAGERPHVRGGDAQGSSEPLWIVEVELPSPPPEVRNSRFFASAMSLLSRNSPSLREERGGKVFFSVYPSAHMVRGLVEKTYAMRVQALMEKKK